MARKINTHGGGAKTNENGLKFERNMSLMDSVLRAGMTVENNEILIDGVPVGMVLRQAEIYKNFLVPHGVNWKEVISGELRPDNAFINYKTKTVYISLRLSIRRVVALLTKSCRLATSRRDSIQSCFLRLVTPQSTSTYVMTGSRSTSMMMCTNTSKIVAASCISMSFP